MSNNPIHRANVFVTMWRPSFVFGLPRDYLFISAFITLVTWPIHQNFIFCLVLYLPMWILGYIKGKSDPEFLSVHLVKIFKLKKTKGTFNGNEYLP